jgi:hypothetical protein
VPFHRVSRQGKAAPSGGDDDNDDGDLAIESQLSVILMDTMYELTASGASEWLPHF